MGLVELFLLGVGLSMDAFAVAVCKGLGMKRVNWAHAFAIALFFGGFQALMPIVGWSLGSQFAAMVEPLSHWIAFALLAAIGAKMFWDSLRGDGQHAPGCGERLEIGEMLMLAVATSIDALAVGVSFAFLGVDIGPACGLIGCTTFAISLAGVCIGSMFGSRWERPSTMAGGIVLIVLGVKILFEHLF